MHRFDIICLGLDKLLARMKTRLATPPIAFIDFEASSLASASFPTEIGWARVVPDGAVTSGAWLIRPLVKWRLFASAWSDASERLTGISLEMLDRDGLPPAEAMRRLLAAVGDGTWFSDEPDWDNHWLAMLAEAAGIDLAGRTLGDARALITAGGIRLTSAETGPRHHRAEPDARQLAALYARMFTAFGTS
jgi:DNA polymerase III epsilon subunit-like protein